EYLKARGVECCVGFFRTFDLLAPIPTAGRGGWSGTFVVRLLATDPDGVRVFAGVAKTVVQDSPVGGEGLVARWMAGMDFHSPASLTTHPSRILSGPPAVWHAIVTTELASIIDFIRYGASRFAAAELIFGHSHDN